MTPEEKKLQFQATARTRIKDLLDEAAVIAKQRKDAPTLVRIAELWATAADLFPFSIYRDNINAPSDAIEDTPPA